MNTTILRKQTSFRLNEELIENLRQEAKLHNRSLNNYVESILMAFIAKKPNKTTLASMNEAENGKGLDTLDLANFHSFVDSL